MAFAMRSLPVPVSPRIRTVASVCEAREAESRTSRRPLDRPIKFSETKLSIDAASQSSNLFQQRAPFQGAIDHGFQVVGMHRLGEVVKRAKFHRVYSRGHGPVTGKNHNRCLRILDADFLQEIEPGFSGQIHIRDYEIDRGPTQKGKRLRDIGCSRRIVTGAVQLRFS